MPRWPWYGGAIAFSGALVIACSSFTAGVEPPATDAAAPADARAPIDEDANAPTELAADPPTALAAGTNVACALRRSGRLACWGSNLFGAVGVDATNDQNCAPASNACRQSATTPTSVANVRQVSVSYENVCAVTNANELLCWGKNTDDGALGSGSVEPGQFVTPYHVGLSNVIDVATTKTGGCARVNGDGGVRVSCWGGTGIGLTGQPALPTRVVAPVAFPALDGAKALRMTSDYPGLACAITADDHVVCWGLASHGSLGTSVVTDACEYGNPCSPTPLPVGDASFLADDVQVGKVFACALRAGVVSCWGYNGEGALGQGRTDDDAHPAPVVLSSLPPIAKIAARGDHVCALARDGGELFCWGLDASGELAGFTAEHGDFFASCESTPKRTTELAGFTDVAAGSGFTLAQKDDRLYAWGNNTSGQLGHSRSDDRAGNCNDVNRVCNPNPTEVVLP